MNHCIMFEATNAAEYMGKIFPQFILRTLMVDRQFSKIKNLTIYKNSIKYFPKLQM